MSQKLIYRTNKEFDKCAELLRNVLTVQESHHNSKSPFGEAKGSKKQQLFANATSKTWYHEANNDKLSVEKKNVSSHKEIPTDRPYYPVNNTSDGVNGLKKEETLVLKNRVTPNKTRKHLSYSSSPTRIIPQRLTSPLKNNPLIHNKSQKKSSPSSFYHRTRNKQDLVRSSSCIDLPSLNVDISHQEHRNFLHDKLIRYLTLIRIISKQIQTQTWKNITDPQSHHLWNELEKCITSALTYANNEIQLQSSFIQLQYEINELRRQVQTTNVHLHEYGLTHQNNEQYVHRQKIFNTNHIQYKESLLHNKELTMKCQLLQDKINRLERNNIQLIQRLTQQDVRSSVKHSSQTVKDNDSLRHAEIISSKKKLCSLYNDLGTLRNRNHSLENLIKEHDEQLLLYTRKISVLKQSAQTLLDDFENHSIENKIKSFLRCILADESYRGITENNIDKTQLVSTKLTSPTFKPSSTLFNIPKKIVNTYSTPLPAFQSYALTNEKTNKNQEKPLYVNPIVLNDSNALSKFQYNRIVDTDITCSSSTTVDDADSIVLSSSSALLSYQQRKHNTLYNSLPILPTSLNTDSIRKIAKNRKRQISNDDSDLELDQISDLTSKIFTSGDEEDFLIVDNNASSSSSITISSCNEKQVYI